MQFKILGQTPRDGKRWQIGEETARDLERLGKVEIVDGIVKKAVYPEDEIDKRKFIPFWSHFTSKEYGTSQTGKDLVNTIMGRAIGFDTVKPPKLIEELLSHFPQNSIILDSFAGSGTTAHAVLNMNKDGGDRKFILVEMEDYAETITAERVRRVIDGYGEKEGTGGGFSFYELGEVLMHPDGNLNEEVGAARIREYVWYMETKTPPQTTKSDNPYYLGETGGTAYYFNYEREQATTLDGAFLAKIDVKVSHYVIYADRLAISEKELSRLNITFKKIPRDIEKL
jgi:adenine-specific DNA-methyltransferase